jgi:hypothetical protein
LAEARPIRNDKGGNVRIWKAGLALAAIAALGASRAAALESLTGVYQGKVKCAGLLGGGKVKDKLDVEVRIVDLSGQILLDVSELGTFEGFAATESQKPDRGKLSVVSCLLTVVSQEGSVLHADIQNKAGTTKASFKGTLVRTDPSTLDARICDIKVKRVSTASPKVAPCE